MNFLINPLYDSDSYKSILNLVKKNKNVTLSGPSESQKAHISYAILEHLDRKGIFIAFNEMQARKMYDDFQVFFGDDAIFLPSKEIILHDIEAKSSEEIFERINTQDRISSGKYKVLVTSPEAFVHKLVTPEKFKESVLSYITGGNINLSEFAEKLVSIGYERVDAVDGMGQFSIRGGIIDVFSINYENAVRIELFDNEIDSMRSFDVLSQRSIEKLDEIRILPVIDVIYSVAERDRVISDINDEFEKYTKKLQLKNIGKIKNEIQSKENTERINKIREKAESDIEALKNDYYFPGIDRLISFILNNPADITKYDKKALIFIDEPGRFSQRVENLLLEYNETCENLLEKAQILPKSFEGLFGSDEIEKIISGTQHIDLSSIHHDDSTGDAYGDDLSARISRSDSGESEHQSFEVKSSAINSYQGHIEILSADLKEWKKKKYKTVVLSGPRGRGERLCETLVANGIESYYTEKIDKELQPGQVVITHGSLNKGFIYPSIGLVVVSDKEVFGSERRISRPSPKYNASKINLFTELKPGDYVVHQAHGIGRFTGIQQLVVENVKRDYIKIKYQDEANLYIPTNQLDLIQKYIGSEGKAPRISKLGGTDWVRTKKKVSDSLQELAGELVKLYAERQSAKGIKYSPDTVWQKQFEELFPYQETDEQLKCIEEIKRDMESPKPMDRLLCGDVGYGKTEVALRAIFKGVMEGKQVAYLVPTTVLAQQHYSTFKDRMRDFPITVDVISRFRTQAEQKKIVKNVKSGNIDILIGTHRLIQKDISFKNLGLLIIDEEQRFGVSHKEKIKNIMPNVDVLTLTATPIPRTLHMSLSGIRDISIIEDPPEERYPIQTYVMEYNADVVRNAIMREMTRNGQVFYLSNRVRAIQKKATDIQAMIPNARIAVAHGQMNERQLEDIMFGFVNKDFDILICTTIIESGLDMPNVNTIIVEDADRMGLAQLYQLRGRVGRSNRLAYAYITYRRDKILTEIAEKRLQAIKEFTEFGSGFKIAMRDLELRGAGNLLGAEQHGHLESVGYDMYTRLLEEAVRAKKGERPAESEIETSIDIKISAYIDSGYITSENQKIEMYKKIAAIAEEEDAMDIKDELIDRYGDIPQSTGNLIQIALNKSLAKKCGLDSVAEKNDSIILTYGAGTKLKLETLSSLMEEYKRQLLFTASETPYITYRIKDIKRENLLDNLKNLLLKIIRLKSAE
ncbi:MAG: transcription-repair coupling factor [Clostridia bacterium]|jgi:transcription-repair coupling factor (superfamily II helicase)